MKFFPAKVLDEREMEFRSIQIEKRGVSLRAGWILIIIEGAKRLRNSFSS
jgi:hypothetical protein